MSRRIWIFLIFIEGLILASSCKNDDIKNNLPLTDIEGNVYQTVTIGTQVWMVENLKTTRYNDGTAIPKLPDTISLENIVRPGYCWYNNDSATFKSTYGALYNWYTINTGKLCPKGWHVPEQSEWETLISCLGGQFVAGAKLKESGTEHWLSPNKDADNSSGFNALPGGYYTSIGKGSYNLGNYGYYWSATESGEASACYLRLCSDYSDAPLYFFYKMEYYSIRCVKD